MHERCEPNAKWTGKLADTQWPLILFAPSLIVPPADPLADMTKIDAGAELFFIPLWMDLGLHLVPAVALLLGESCSYAADQFLPVANARLLPPGTQVHPANVDPRCLPHRPWRRNLIRDLGRALCCHQRQVPVPIPNGRELRKPLQDLHWGWHFRAACLLGTQLAAQVSPGIVSTDQWR